MAPLTFSAPDTKATNSLAYVWILRLYLYNRAYIIIMHLSGFLNLSNLWSLHMFLY